MATRQPGTRHKRPSKIRSLVLFLGASVLAGLLVAGLAVPFAALAGVSGTVIKDSVDNLPLDLYTPPEAMRSTVYLADGSVWTQLYDENRVVLESLDDVSPLMRAAQVDIEDVRFYEHGAMDLTGTLRALVSNIAGGATQGGSSITQQYVKLVRIEEAVANDDKEQLAAVQATTLTRKIEEMRYAIKIEETLSKDEILLRYLNLAYYGDQSYGIESAAVHYFGVHAKDLNLVQSAMLAGIVQNPNLNPVDAAEEAVEKRNLVLDAMVNAGHIAQYLEEGLIKPAQCADLDLTTEEGKAQCDEATSGLSPEELADAVVQQAKETPFDQSAVKASTSGCTDVRYSIPCHFMELSLYNDPSFGNTRAERERNVKRGGYNIYTTLRPDFQDPAQDAVSAFAAATDPIIVTLNEVQPGTGAIWAMAQNRPIYGFDKAAGETSYVYSASEAYGGSQGYQAGSTFKSFTVAAAIDAGLPPKLRISSPASMVIPYGRKFTGCDGTQSSQIWDAGGWKVSGGGGTIDMYAAAAQSVNTYFAQLVLRVGPCAAAKMAKATGVELANGTDLVYGDPAKADARLAEGESDAGYRGYSEIPAFTLGVAEVTPLSMAGAFATYGARGKACTPSMIAEVKNRDGETIKNYNLGTDNCVVDAVRPEVMDAVNSVLKGVTFNGLGSTSKLDGRDQGAKTGTTETNDNVWLVSYTPEIAASVMIAADVNVDFVPFWDAHGNNNGVSDQSDRDMRGVQMPSGRVLQGWSWQDPPLIFNPALKAVIGALPATAFTAPTAEILKGTPATPPRCGGDYNSMVACFEAAGYSTARTEVFNEAKAGTFISSSCDYYLGGLCSLIYSKGPKPEPPSTTPSAQPTP